MNSYSRIEGIRIKNYRVLRNVVVSNLPRMMVLIGTNGSGKSTLFDVFSFFQEALNQNTSLAVARRGGFRELLSRGADGPIELTIKFRESGGRLASYTVELGTVEGQVVVNREVLSYRRGQQGRSPWNFVDFKRGVGKAIANESDYGQEGATENWEYHELSDPSALAIKGLGQFKNYRVVAELRSMIDSWYISDLQIPSARFSQENWYAEHLSRSGENVSQVAKYLNERHPNNFKRVLDAMRLRVPGVSNVEARATEDGRLVLQFQETAFDDPFSTRHVSDGTIRMFAYLIMLHDPNPHALLAVEEPETQMYPELQQELAAEFRGYAQRGGQVLVSTHSPEFLNGAELEEVYWLEKRDGFSTVKRASDSELLRSLSSGAQPGYLWNHNLFKGAGLSWFT